MYFKKERVFNRVGLSSCLNAVTASKVNTVLTVNTAIVNYLVAAFWLILTVIVGRRPFNLCHVVFLHTSPVLFD